VLDDAVDVSAGQDEQGDGGPPVDGTSPRMRVAVTLGLVVIAALLRSQPPRVISPEYAGGR
jgi:hypothetical protein